MAESSFKELWRSGHLARNETDAPPSPQVPQDRPLDCAPPAKGKGPTKRRLSADGKRARQKVRRRSLDTPRKGNKAPKGGVPPDGKGSVATGKEEPPRLEETSVAPASQAEEVPAGTSPPPSGGKSAAAAALPQDDVAAPAEPEPVPVPTPPPPKEQPPPPTPPAAATASVSGAPPLAGKDPWWFVDRVACSQPPPLTSASLDCIRAVLRSGSAASVVPNTPSAHYV